MNRYTRVFALGIAGAALVTALLRVPHLAPLAPAAHAARADTVALAVELWPGRVVAAPRSVAVGRPVALTVVNHTRQPVRLALAGYEDRVTAAALAAGATWRTAFLADRPGEQLAWLVDGTPQGRLDVLGSHLVEGHQ